MHFMLAKPIARGEVFLYRLLGFYALAWVYLTLLIALLAFITGLLGRGRHLPIRRPRRVDVRLVGLRTGHHGVRDAVLHARRDVEARHGSRPSVCGLGVGHDIDHAGRS